MHSTVAGGGPVGRFAVAQIWEDAWDRVAGSKRTFIAMASIVMIVAALLGFALSWLLARLGVASAPLTLGSQPFPLPEGSAALQIIISPLWAGIAAAGLERARGNPIRVSLLFENRQCWPRIVSLAVLVVIVQWMALLVLPLAATGVATFVLQQLSMLAVLFIIDRGSSLGEALSGALRIVLANPLHYLLYLLVVGLLAALAGVTLGLALLWVLPFLNISAALIYIRGSNAAHI